MSERKKGAVTMAVHFYDAAYDLEKALRNSDEYSRLRGLYDQVNADESADRKSVV